ncbi:MAG: 5-(carboxyamino)imidazole ribonucleotide synthase [Methyloligellaceae bacterium]
MNTGVGKGLLQLQSFLSMKGDARLKPGSRIGIIGGGQLGRMLAMAAAQLGFHVHIYAPEDKPPAAEVSEHHTCAEYNDVEALSRFARSVDVITYEFENIPAQPVASLSGIAPLFPPVSALSVTQDRLDEKNFLSGLSIPVARFASIDSLSDLENARKDIGLPAMLKTRRFGYDGKGQAKLSDSCDLEVIYQDFEDVPAVFEAFIPFECELSVVMARGMDGTSFAYDVSRNDHVNQILNKSVVPSGISQAVTSEAISIAKVFADAVDYVGVLAVEFFYCGDKAEKPLIVNEIAPRVHNTGHWTMDGCAVGQFENHIRAIAGWPLGDGLRHSNAEMLNLIGDEMNMWADYAQESNTIVHLYGKSEIRAGRKMGHITKLKPLT